MATSKSISAERTGSAAGSAGIAGGHAAISPAVQSSPPEASSSSKKLVYSQSMALDDFDPEKKLLQESLERMEQEKDAISRHLHQLEEESSMLREMFNTASKELNDFKKPALLVAEIVTLMDNNKAIIRVPNGNKFYCHIAQELKDLRNNDQVLIDQKTLNVVRRIDMASAFDVERFMIMEKPPENWGCIGGLQQEIKEMKEVIELPLKEPALFEKIGIHPPKGVLLYGPPGTGKTLLAKAAANSTNAAFIEIVGSELVQKFIGEGAKLVKELFALAKRKAPAIIFIDEIDAIAAVRLEIGISGEREVNRTFMQLLAELDGFDSLGNVKVIAATNRPDILDTAVTRPGRLERLIEVGLPDEKGRLEILKVHSSKMHLTKVNMKVLAKEMENFSGAEIKAVCTEAGYAAIREKRNSVTQADFLQAIESVRVENEDDDAKGLFG